MATLGLSCGMWTLSWGMWNLVPSPGVDPVPAWGAWSLTKEVPGDLSLKIKHNFIFGQGVDFHDFTYMESRFAKELEEDTMGAEGKGTMGVCRSESHLHTYKCIFIYICLEGKLWQARQHIKKQRHPFADKRSPSQRYGFSSSHVRMWELDH